MRGRSDTRHPPYRLHRGDRVEVEPAVRLVEPSRSLSSASPTSYRTGHDTPMSTTASPGLCHRHTGRDPVHEEQPRRRYRPVEPHRSTTLRGSRQMRETRTLCESPENPQVSPLHKWQQAPEQVRASRPRWAPWPPRIGFFAAHRHAARAISPSSRSLTPSRLSMASLLSRSQAALEIPSRWRRTVGRTAVDRGCRRLRARMGHGHDRVGRRHSDGRPEVR